MADLAPASATTVNDNQRYNDTTGKAGSRTTGAALVNKADAKSPPKGHLTKMAAVNCTM